MLGTVLHLVANLDRGGAQEVVRTLVRALPATGWRPLVATFRDGPLRADIEADGVPVRILAGRGHSLGSPLSAAAELRAMRGELRALMRDEQVNVVQTHLLGSTDFLTLAARDRGAPAVLWTVHNALLDLRPDQLPAGQRRLLGAKRAGYRIAYRLGGRVADGFVAVSDDVASAVVRAYHPPRGRLFVIPNGIDVDRYGARHDRDAVRRELGLTSRGRIVIVVAKLYAQKGHAVLLEALGSGGLGAEDVVLLVGEGPERESLERLVGERGLTGVRFLGNRPDVPRLLAASDLFILPSLWEGLPMALLEAMASRLAVIATDVAGSRQVVISGESGRLVPPGDPAALAADLTELLSNDTERERLAGGARRRVEAEFSATRQAERHAAMYERVLARRQPS